MKTHHTRAGSAVPRAKVDECVDWKFWYDQNTSMWCIQRRDNVGGVCMVPTLRLEELDIQSDGRFLVCRAELLVDGRTMKQSPTAVTSKHATLRMLRVYDQVLHVSPVSLSGSVSRLS